MQQCSRDHQPNTRIELRIFDADAGNELDQGWLRAYVRFQMPRPDCHGVGSSGSMVTFESDSEIEGFGSVRGLRHPGFLASPHWGSRLFPALPNRGHRGHHLI
jgi:hypothetical protein